MPRIFLKSILIVGCIIISNCNNKAKKNGLNFYQFSKDSIFTPRIQPAPVTDFAKTKLLGWVNFRYLQESINQIGFSKALSENTTTNNTYQSLYYQILALHENIQRLNASVFTPEVDTKPIRSRLGLLQTYTLELKSQMETRIDISNSEIIAYIENIFGAYNALLSEVAREYDKNLKKPNFQEIFNEETIRKKDDFFINAQ